MRTPNVEELIRNMPKSLGSYAPVLDEIEAALESPQCSLVTIGEAIERDPDLTARLLRLGNSAFYGYSTRLSTVAEALSLIGIQQVQDLILASSIIEHFKGLPADFLDMESFWRHSLACGIAARLLAMEKRLPKSEKFFVAGLLHDVGRLVLLMQAPELARKVVERYRGGGILLQEAEREVLGYDHQAIVHALLRHWKFPDFILQAIGHHHEVMPGVIPSLESIVVHFADYLVSAMQIGTSGEQFVPPVDSRAWDLLGLTPAGLTSLAAAIDEQMEAVEAAFLVA